MPLIRFAKGKYCKGDGPILAPIWCTFFLTCDIWTCDTFPCPKLEPKNWWPGVGWEVPSGPKMSIFSPKTAVKSTENGQTKENG